jgi:hypothetical protein
LGLAANNLGAAAVQALIDSPYLNLNYLNVRMNFLDTNDIQALQERFPAALIEA